MDELRPRQKLWLERDGRVVMSDYRVRLLQLVQESGSLARAAAAMGLSYRRAWGKVKELEAALGFPIVSSEVGGAGGGHTALTPEGADFVAAYERFQARANEGISAAFAAAFPAPLADMPNTIVYLIGHPGVGKYTVATELARLTGARVVDNHLLNNPIFTLLPYGLTGAVLREAFRRIGQIRALVLKSMVDLAPPGYSFILTNVIDADDPEDVAGFDRLAAVAEARGAAFVPVLLSCTSEEQSRRVTSPSRALQYKWTDAEAVREVTERVRLFEPRHPNTLRLDTTALTPAEAARAILDWAAGHS
jgi:molybdate transport repressor ModE-like protein